jgi:uncharacterized protein YndB with AHSA1/START domain
VGDSALVLECDYEFSRAIVWDALVDSDLVSGWWAEATITPEVGGEYNLRWLHRIGQPDTFARITDMQQPGRLVVDTSDSVLITFELTELPGGLRGESTRLKVTVDGPGADPRVTADWLTNLDQLEDLLRGHPVDWANWNRDRFESWRRHLGEATAPTGSGSTA